MARLEPVHPGEILKHDFMEPFGLSSTGLAKVIRVTPARFNEIVRGRRGITAETALRLAKFFRTDAQSWMSLQDQYEPAIAEREAAAAIKGTSQNPLFSRAALRGAKKEEVRCVSGSVLDPLTRGKPTLCNSLIGVIADSQTVSPGRRSDAWSTTP